MGVRGGNPITGFPPLFTFVRVRRCVWAVSLGPAARHPISFALAKRNGVSPKEKRPLVRIFLIAGRTLCCTCRKQLPCPSGWHVRPRRRLPVASTARQAPTSPSPGANGAFRFALTTERHCQRRVRPAIVKIRTKRFSLTARHRFFWQDKRNGVERAAGPYATAHTQRRTRTNVKRGNPRRGFPLDPLLRFCEHRGVPRSAERGQRLCLWTPPPLKRWTKLLNARVARSEGRQFLRQVEGRNKMSIG